MVITLAHEPELPLRTLLPPPRSQCSLTLLPNQEKAVVLNFLLLNWDWPGTRALESHWMDGVGLGLASAHPAHLPPQGSHPSAPGSSQARLDPSVSRPKENEPRLPSTLPISCLGTHLFPRLWALGMSPHFRKTLTFNHRWVCGVILLLAWELHGKSTPYDAILTRDTQRVASRVSSPRCLWPRVSKAQDSCMEHWHTGQHAYPTSLSPCIPRGNNRCYSYSVKRWTAPQKVTCPIWGHRVQTETLPPVLFLTWAIFFLPSGISF